MNVNMARTAPSPACGGGLGWGHTLQIAPPIPTFPRGREKEIHQ